MSSTATSSVIPICFGRFNPQTNPCNSCALVDQCQLRSLTQPPDHAPSGDVGTHGDRTFRNRFRKVARKSENLTGQEFLVLDALLSFADADGGNCFPSIRMLSESTGKDVRYLRKLIARLKRKGWIEVYPLVAPNGGTGSNLYRFQLPSREIGQGNREEWIGALCWSNAEKYVPVFRK